MPANGEVAKVATVEKAPPGTAWRGFFLMPLGSCNRTDVRARRSQSVALDRTEDRRVRRDKSFSVNLGS